MPVSADMPIATNGRKQDLCVIDREDIAVTSPLSTEGFMCNQILILG